MQFEYANDKILEGLTPDKIENIENHMAAAVKKLGYNPQHFVVQEAIGPCEGNLYMTLKQRDESGRTIAVEVKGVC